MSESDKKVLAITGALVRFRLWCWMVLCGIIKFLFSLLSNLAVFLVVTAITICMIVLALYVYVELSGQPFMMVFG